MNNEHHTFLTGLLGMAASATGVTVSMLPAVESWLRIASLSVGLLVGLITAWKLLRK